MDRFAIVHGFWLYATLWNGENAAQGYWRRLNRLAYRPSLTAERLEASEPEARAVYGSLVRRHHADYVAYERLHRRRPDVFPLWPGSHHAGTCATFVRGLGLPVRALDCWS